MENLILSFNVVFPLFLLMAIGYITRRVKLYDDKSHKVMNNVAFRVFLPVLVYKNISSIDLSNGIDGRVFAFTGVALVVLFGLLFLLVPVFIKDNSRRGVLIQALGRSNYVLFGIPLATLLFGEGNLGIPSLLIAVSVPFFNVCSVIALEMYSGGKVKPARVIKGIVTNPLILGTAVGMLALLTGFQLPAVLQTTVNDLAKVASPLSLFLLGGAFEFSKVGRNVKILCGTLLFKLILIPAVAVAAAALLGFRGLELASIMIVFAAPAAVNSYTMALTTPNTDAELAGQIVVFSTAACVLTMFLFIFTLKQIGLI